MSLLGRLLGLMKRRPLSEPEMRSLAHELNRSIIGNTRPPPCFTSSRSFTQSDIAERCLRIDWFAACGKPIDRTDVCIEDELVGSWEDAVRSAGAREWDDATQGARTGLQSWLHHSGKGVYSEFNRIIAKFDAAVVRPRVLPALTAAVESRGWTSSDAIVGALRRILWGAYAENAVIDTGHRSFFFLELFELVEAGHCPCGWVGRWPAGRLLVF